MNADEIVRELREMATYDCNYEEESDAAIEAIRLIKSLQAENKALREASQKVLEGLQKLDSALDNTTCDGDALKAQLSASQRRERAARNELCLKCGLYHDAHNGACDGCRWREN